MHLRVRAIILSAAIAALASPLYADDIYTGLNTSWSDATAWTNQLPPVSTDSVFITPTINDGSSNTLTLDVPSTVNAVTLGATGNGTALLNLNNQNLTATSITILNTGQLSGTGIFSGSFNNAGTVSTSATLRLNTSNTGSGTNSGNLTAITGGDLQLTTPGSEGGGTPFNNSGGIIAAIGDPAAPSYTAFVDITGWFITGGQISSNAGGQVRFNQSGAIANSTISGNILINAQLGVADCIISGNVTQATNSLLFYSGTITNNANLSGPPIYISGPVTFDGNGSIFFRLGLYVETANATLTIGSQQTVYAPSVTLSIPFINHGSVVADATHGGGFLSTTANGSIFNDGTIAATQGASFFLSGSINTVGTLAARCGGNLRLSGSTNNSGTFTATGASANGTASVISLTGSTIIAGNLSTDSSGIIVLSNTTLSNVSLAGNFVSANNTFNFLANVSLGSSLNLTGAFYASGYIAHSGAITISGTGYFTTLGNQSVTLAGTGSILLNGAGIGPNLIIPSTQPISGYGGISISQNSATINANVANNFIVIGAAATLTNNGLLTATNGGIVFIQGGNLRTLDNTNGTISAIGASATNVKSQVALGSLTSAFTVSGGTLLTDATGSIALNNTTLSNAQLTGNFVGNAPLLSNDTLVNTFTTKGTLYVAGTLTDNATWSNATIRFNDQVNITGHGSILLLGGTLNPGKANSSIVTLGGGISLQGYGSANTLVANGTIAFLNNGSIIADPDPTAIGATTPRTFSLPIYTSLTNSGTLSALPNATLALASPTTASLNDIGGSILAAGGTVTLSNLSLFGGSLSTSNAGQIQFLNSNTLTNTTLSGNLTANGTLTLAGTVTSNASLLSNATLALADGSVFSSAGVTKVSSLSLASTAAYNLSAGALIVTDPSALSALQAAIAQGSTSTHGLFTTVPNAALVLLNNAVLPTPFTTFGGVAVDANSILIAPELLGDATLDGHIDLNDLNTVLNNLGTTTSLWTNGNFDGAPTIDLNDLNDVLNNLGTTFSSASNSVLAAEALLANSPSTAPEPASSLILLLAAPLIFQRRARTSIKPSHMPVTRASSPHSCIPLGVTIWTSTGINCGRDARITANQSHSKFIFPLS